MRICGPGSPVCVLRRIAAAFTDHAIDAVRQAFDLLAASGGIEGAYIFGSLTEKLPRRIFFLHGQVEKNRLLADDADDIPPIGRIQLCHGSFFYLDVVRCSRIETVDQVGQGRFPGAAFTLDGDMFTFAVGQ